jgi:hypothetical protein
LPIVRRAPEDNVKTFLGRGNAQSITDGGVSNTFVCAEGGAEGTLRYVPYFNSGAS